MTSAFRSVALARCRGVAAAVVLGALVTVASTSCTDRGEEDGAGSSPEPTAVPPSQTASSNVTTARSTSALARHGILVSAPTGMPSVTGEHAVRWPARHLAKRITEVPAAVLYTVTVTRAERHTRVGALTRGPIKDRLAWVVTSPPMGYPEGGDPFSVGRWRQQLVTLIDAETGGVLLIDRFPPPY